MYGDPDSKVHGANMGPIWGQQDPRGPHVGHLNFAIWGRTRDSFTNHFISFLCFYLWCKRYPPSLSLRNGIRDIDIKLNLRQMGLIISDIDIEFIDWCVIY